MEPLAPAQRRVLVTACLAHGLIHIAELAVPALLLLIQFELGADDYVMGRVVAIYGLLFGLGSLPAGWLVDRIGSRPLVVLCLWGAAAGLVGMSLAGSIVALTVPAALMGLSLSIYHPAGTSLITHTMPPSGRVFALHGMAGNLGVAGAGLVAGGLGALVGWRWALVAIAGAATLLGAAALRLPTPTQHEIRTGEGRGRPLAFVLLLVAAAFIGMVYRGLTTFLPKFFAVRLIDDVQTGTAVGGALTTATLLVGIAGMYLSGRLADRGVSPAVVFLAGGVLQLPFLVAIGSSPNAGLVPLAMAVAFFHFVTQPVGNQMVSRFTPPRLRGLGYGLYFFLAFGAGSFGAGLGGWISRSFGLERTFPALALVLVPAVAASVLLVLAARRHGPDTVSNPSPD